MDPGRSDGLPGPGDSEAPVAQLLSQFNSSSRPTSARDVGPENRESRNSEIAQTTQYPSVEVVVPIVENPSDYKYLPGHFVARRILHVDSTDPQQPLYTVRLRTGERETVRHNHLSLTFQITEFSHIVFVYR